MKHPTTGAKPICFSDTRPLPTHEQLAMIAATLAKRSEDKPDKLVDTALQIWMSVGNKLANVVCGSTVTASIGNFLHDKDITRDEFIKELLPPSSRKRSAEWGAIGRAYSRYRFRQEFKREPSEKEGDDFYTEWKPGKGEEANALVPDFLDWYSKRIAEKRSAAGKKPRRKGEKQRPPRSKLREILSNLE